MRSSLLALLGLVLAAAPCAADPLPVFQPPDAAPATEADTAPVAELAPPPALSPAAVEAEAARLRAALQREVPDVLPRTPARDRAKLRRAMQAVAASEQAIERPELLVVVDRNPRVQELSIVLARPDGPWEMIGSTKVSTGQVGRFDHFITPLGVFPHTDAILDYRAEGTFNENHIRGLGLKGMRVWDFGWQMGDKGWRADRESGEMRLLMHATDPANLAHRIGRPASAGCVRIPAAMNRFLDRHGVLDFDYERAAQDDIQYRALLLPGRVPTPLAGDALVVVDSSLDAPGPAAPLPTASLSPAASELLSRLSGDP